MYISHGSYFECKILYVKDRFSTEQKELKMCLDMIFLKLYMKKNNCCSISTTAAEIDSTVECYHIILSLS